MAATAVSPPAELRTHASTSIHAFHAHFAPAKQPHVPDVRGCNADKSRGNDNVACAKYTVFDLYSCYQRKVLLLGRMIPPEGQVHLRSKVHGQRPVQCASQRILRIHSDWETSRTLRTTSSQLSQCKVDSGWLRPLERPCTVAAA